MKYRCWRYILLLLVVGLAFSLRLYHLEAQSIWWDEGHSIFVAGHPITQIPTLPAMDVHPPAYFILLRLWIQLTGLSEFSLRYLSVIFSLLTVALLGRFALSLSASRYASSTLPLLATLPAALSPLYVAYAQEVRSYALFTFLILGSSFMLWQLLSRTGSGPPRTRLWLAYILLTAASLYTHYFTIFLLLFQNLAWLAWVWAAPSRNRWPRLRLWSGSQAGILLLFTPQLLLAMNQVTSYTNPNLAPPGLLHFINHSWQAYTVGLTIDPVPARWGMAAIAGVLMLALFIQLTQSGRGAPRPILSRPLFLFLAGWFLIPLAAYFMVLQNQASFEPRYLMPVTPALFLLLAVSLAGLTESAKLVRYTQRFLFLILVAVLTGSLYSYYTAEAYFKDDSAGVAAWLAAETTANDIVYVDVPHPFHYYAKRGRIPAPIRYLFVDIHTAAETLNREARGRDRLFWVTWWGSDTDPRGVIPFLAQKFGQKLGQRDFRGYQVQWFSLPPPETAFSLPTTLPPAEAIFGPILRLDGAAYGGQPPQGRSLSAGQSAWAVLHFTLLQDTATDYRVSVRLRGQSGHLAAQVDKDLLNDRHFRTSAWPLADPALNQALNVYTLALDPDTPPGSYQLEVVVYQAQPPYPGEGVTGANRSQDGTAAILGQIMVTP